MNDRGALIIISGFSGVGKGTIVRRLTERYEDYVISISVTTRKPREGEVDGREYFYLTEDEFSEMAESGKLIEYAGYVGHHYGTPREPVEKALAEGLNIILEIEIQGALKVRAQYPDAILVFVLPPSVEELKRRLDLRGTESDREITHRLRRAAEEAEGIEEYDYILVNDDIEECVDRLHSIVECCTSRVEVNLDLIDRIREELNRSLEGE